MEFIDEYEHNVPGVLYFARNLPSNEVLDLYDYSLEGCQCETECTEDNACSCIAKSGTIYKYGNIYDIVNYTIQEKRIKSPTYECNENCSCNERVCGNKLVQFGPRKSLKVESCENDKGEIITENQAFPRFNANSEQNKMNYIFCIREHFGDKEVKTFIDPTHYGNIGRYINHSCEPNCKLYVIRIKDALPILGIFANEEIKDNDEITYDYQEGDLNIHGNHVKKLCLCNSRRCRKYLPFDVSLST